MQNISFHIAYLLTRHECVIVPGLGAFVAYPSDRKKTSRWEILSPPENFLGFNSEIKHNDGLLANSIAKEKKCSYKEANTLIEQYVIQVLHSFDEEKRVNIPWVGSLYSKDNKILFQPGRTLSCNALNYGLTGFSLPYLQDLQKEAAISPKKNNKEVVWIPVNRKLIAYAGSVAAAVIAMFIIPTPLNDGHPNQASTKYASLLQFSTQNQVVEETADTSEATIQLPVEPETVVTPAEIATPAPKAINQAKTTTFHYYIIVASWPNQISAKKSIAEFQSKGFKNAAILSTDGKHRIYTNRFENKAEAEKFLVKFRKDYPMHANAWLLKQKD